MWVFKLIPLVALITSAVMIYLAIDSLRTERKLPRWRWRKAWDLILLLIGFVCMVLTSIYALLAASIWL